jgi:hypothetical protein
MEAVDGGGAALYVTDGEHFVPTALTAGPWDPEAQFGGAPAALLATLIDETPSLVPLQVARLTVDLLRPVPLRPLTADRAVVREGKRIQVIQASLRAGGVEVARASALRVRIADLGDIELPGPEGGAPIRAPERAGQGAPAGAGHPDAERPLSGREPEASAHPVEYLHRPCGGFFPNPSWLRLRAAVIAGQPAAPIARLAYLADHASGFGNHRGVPLVGINADLSLNVVRYPSDGWICLSGRGWTSPAGIGQVQATLSDAAGVVAGVSMVRLVERSPAGAGG